MKDIRFKVVGMVISMICGYHSGYHDLEHHLEFAHLMIFKTNCDAQFYNQTQLLLLAHHNMAQRSIASVVLLVRRSTCWKWWKFCD